jgi:tetratricopeptide (TPR) repeat protein
MRRLRETYLNVPLDTVLHPASPFAQQTAREEQAAAGSAPAVQEQELTAQEWFERGFDANDPDEQLRCYTEAFRLQPNYAAALYNRGIARRDKGDLDGALKDYTEAIRLQPNYAGAFNNRGNTRRDKGDLDGALKDYTEAIRLKPDYAGAFYNRALIWNDKTDYKAAITDYQKYLDSGGVIRDGDQLEVEQRIRDLTKKLKVSIERKKNRV